jgi:hypothetical protein
MQSVINTHVQKSNRIEELYNQCTDKAMGRIKRTYEEEQCTHMTLRVGEVAGLKGFLSPYSMHDLVKVVRFTLEISGVRVHKCHDPYHLRVDWGGMLKESTCPCVSVAKHIKLPKHATADGGPRYVFNGEHSAAVPMLDLMSNPLKCH